MNETNQTLTELINLINQHKKEEDVSGRKVSIPLLWKYWYAECGNQEIFEDLSYEMDREYIDEAIGLIQLCEPENLTGEYAELYQEYKKEIEEEREEDQEE